MKLAKKAWHRYWSKWHLEESVICFFNRNQFSASTHAFKYLEHANRYIELGGDPKHVRRDLFM